MTVATPAALILGVIAGWIAGRAIRPPRRPPSAEGLLADLRAAVPSADLRIERGGTHCRTIRAHDGRITLDLGGCEAPDADAHEALHAAVALAGQGHEEAVVRTVTRWVVQGPPG